jgi:hypothetical protein
MDYFLNSSPTQVWKKRQNVYIHWTHLISFRLVGTFSSRQQQTTADEQLECCARTSGFRSESAWKCVSLVFQQSCPCTVRTDSMEEALCTINLYARCFVCRWKLFSRLLLVDAAASTLDIPITEPTGKK